VNIKVHKGHGKKSSCKSVLVNREGEKQRKQQWGKKTGMSKSLWTKENVTILGD